MESMTTATVIEDGECQMILLPKGFRLPTPNVSVRRAGDAIVLAPIKPATGPDGVFGSIHITDPAFEHMEQNT